MYPARVELLTIVFFCSLEAPLDMPPLQLENFITSQTTTGGCGGVRPTTFTVGHIVTVWKVFLSLQEIFYNYSFY